MKKDDPVVHCLLTFFQNLETVGVPKRKNKLIPQHMSFFTRGSELVTSICTCMYTQLFHLWKEIISSKFVAHKSIVRVKSPVVVQLVAARGKLALAHWAVLEVITAQVLAWALQQTGITAQTFFQFRPNGKALL